MIFFLKNIFKKIRNYSIKLKFHNKNVVFLEGVRIDSSVYLEGNNVIGINNNLSDCVVGKGTYTSSNVDFSHVTIGRFCSIGSNVRNTRGRHPTSIFVSTHPAFFSINMTAGFTFCTKQIFLEKKKVKDSDFLVNIGNDVWIGDNVTILDGITVGNGAIIGANSFVNRDVPPYAIVVGSPAKVQRYRFNDSQINFLEEVKWWTKDFVWLSNNHLLFNDINTFVEYFESNMA